jgi:hypothetical protein
MRRSRLSAGWSLAVALCVGCSARESASTGAETSVDAAAIPSPEASMANPLPAPESGPPA